MVASAKVRCVVVAIPVARTEEIERPGVKPSELLPWADPYIASLVHKLQAEVREERATARRERSSAARLAGEETRFSGFDGGEFQSGVVGELATIG